MQKYELAKFDEADFAILDKMEDGKITTIRQEIEDVNEAMDGLSIKKPAKPKRKFEIMFSNDEVVLVKVYYEGDYSLHETFGIDYIDGCVKHYLKCSIEEFQQALEKFKKQHSLHKT